MSEQEDIEAERTGAWAYEKFGTVHFAQLTQPMRAWAIVGCYMGYFALLENAVMRAMRLVLDMEPLSGEIVGRNTGFIEKVRIVRTAINLGLGDHEKSDIDKLLIEIGKLGEERNVVAHSVLGHDPEESDGVLFSAIEAKGHFRSTTLKWSIAEADLKTARISQLIDLLDAENSQSALTNAALRLRSKHDREKLMRVLGGWALKPDYYPPV